VYLFVDCVFKCEFLRYEYIIGILNTNEIGDMTQTEKDFCTGVEEREKHCGCMRVRECAVLEAKVVRSYGGRVPPSIEGHYEEYRRNASLENEAALCRAVYSEIDPDLREFMHEYQEYVSKENVHELLDRLSRSITEKEEGV
jgi:hypothetical protein